MGAGRRASLLLPCLLGFAIADQAAAQGEDDEDTRLVEFHFTPTSRAQIALWVESADATRFATLRLTQATSARGIGNRPGATQMNSGFRWPYGRREGVLPVWAHRRVAAGEAPFRRVIFQDRVSEGHASRSSSDFSRDDYFCLSFDQERSRRDALDAVTCASVFNSDKGRYATDRDARDGYAEPWEGEDGGGSMRSLPTTSLYPPRRDLENAIGFDHPDVVSFDDDALAVMPELDAVTMATPAGGEDQRIQWEAPDDWPDGDYVAYLEVHTEGDYNDAFNAVTNPTPEAPDGRWDYWAVNFGYPYRGQPSVVFRVPFRLSSAGGTWSADAPDGYGDLHGEDGAIRAMAPGMIADDPTTAPGSGADRLIHGGDGDRFRVVGVPRNLCDGPDPDPRCFVSCSEGEGCDDGFLCDPSSDRCVWACDVEASPQAVGELTVENHPDELRAHEWARVSFRVPESLRAVDRYELRVSRGPIDDEVAFDNARPAFAASRDTVAVRIPDTGEARDLVPDDLVTVDIGQLTPSTDYWIGLRAVDDCNGSGSVAVEQVTTTEVQFTTVTPCFVATAAWGTPMADEVGSLRRVRDRHLQASPLGRTLVATYYEVGPAAAAVVADHPWLAAAVRGVLRPFVTVADWWTSP